MANPHENPFFGPAPANRPPRSNMGTLLPRAAAISVADRLRTTKAEQQVPPVPPVYRVMAVIH